LPPSESQADGPAQGPAGLSSAQEQAEGLGPLSPDRHDRGVSQHLPVNTIQLPCLGRLRLKERASLPTSSTSGVRARSATVSEPSGHWYVSVLVEQERLMPEHAGPVVGVDLGSKRLATLSDGTVVGTI